MIKLLRKKALGITLNIEAQIIKIGKSKSLKLFKSIQMMIRFRKKTFMRISVLQKNRALLTRKVKTIDIMFQGLKSKD